ncbi:MAG: GNAT family N-acetyltransferase [Anaerolineales bacterium]|jgi:predicted acetyltransferase
MSPINIQSLNTEEAAPVFNWLTTYAFHETPPMREPEEFFERFKHTEGYTKYLALYEDDTPVASAGAGPMTQNIRGRLVDSTGIFMVATHPNHRRKGYSFVLLKELFKQMREEGYGVSCLYPFRESFYERLGYANFPPSLIAEINIRGLAPLLDQTIETQLELVEFVQKPELYFEFVERYQRRTHGVATFKKDLPPDPKWHKAWVLASRIHGELDGIMVYSLEGNRPTQFKFNAGRFYTFSPASRYQFLNWIARHLDQTSEVTITLPAFEQPHTWFSDLDIQLSTRNISPMGRVLDISKLTGLPAGDGSFTAEIIDPVCPWNEGIWAFEGQGGTLRVTKAAQADCWLGIQGLSALVYGCLPPENFNYRGWGDFPEKTSQAMKAIFPPLVPHVHAYF